MSITIDNRFLKFKDDFKKDTGLEFNDQNMSLYISYVNARCNDLSSQLLWGLTNQLLNKLDTLPSQTRLEIAQMLNDHQVIKTLLQKLP